MSRTELQGYAQRIFGSFIIASVIADRLQEYLRDEEMSQGELAMRVGVAQATVSRWVRGDMVPSRSSLKKLAEIMGDDPGTVGAWIVSASTTAERIERLEGEVRELRQRLDSLEQGK